MEVIILKATENTKILKQILGSHQDYGWALIYGGFGKHPIATKFTQPQIHKGLALGPGMDKFSIRV